MFEPKAALNIGLVCHEYPPAMHGGIGSSNQDLAEGLAALGHSVFVVGIYPPTGLAADRNDHCIPGVEVVRLPCSAAWMRYRPRALWERWRLRRCLRARHARCPFDLIEFSDYAGWMPWGGPKGVPVVARLQGTNTFFDRELGRAGDAFEHNLELRSLKRADSWIGLSQYVFTKTLALCELDRYPGTTIAHAVDTDLFSPGRPEEIEAGLIVFVNSLNPKKGIEQLLDAMNLICPSHPQAHLAVVGQDTQTKPGGRSYLEQLRERLKPEFRRRVVFTGRLDRQKGALDYLRRAHVCCYPSHMETFGIAPVEAMSVGCPTIFSRVGPGPEVVEDGISGLLCDPFDPKDIASKVGMVFDDVELAARLGREARRRVLALFNKRDWIRKNLEFYQSRIAAAMRGEMIV